MLSRLPSPVQLPQLPAILDDIGQPAPDALAHALGVSVGQVRRWVRAGKAPRPVELSLWWLTRWGQSVVDCEAVNAARLHADVARAAQDEAARLRRELARVLAAADFGCANDYSAEALPPGAVVVPLRARVISGA